MGSPGVHLAEETLVGGKYRIERVLGRGGMGYVYLARHEMLDQHVALKVLSQDAVGNEEATRRLIKEAQLAAKIPGEHICRVTDVGLDESGAPYIAMEHLVGQDLEALLEKSGPLPIHVAVGYVLQALEAIAHAHARGIVHRDLKPSNLFLTTSADGTPVVKVLDFGISKSTSVKQTTITAPTQVLGSPAYMSPEQVRSAKSVDVRTDVWAVGVILFELLTARMPFAGETVGEVFAAILEKEAPPVTRYRSDVPPELARVVEGCLRRRLGERYANASQVAEALAPFASPADAALALAIRNTIGRSSGLPTVPTGPDEVTQPSLQPPAIRATTNTWTGGSRDSLRNRPPWLLVAGATLVGLLLVGGGFAVSRRTSSGGSSSASSPPGAIGSAAGTTSASAASSPAPTAPSTPETASASAADGADASVAPQRIVPTTAKPPARVRPAPQPTAKPTSGLSHDRH
jgi:serine/threonine-protein kinase